MWDDPLSLTRSYPLTRSARVTAWVDALHRAASRGDPTSWNGRTSALTAGACRPSFDAR